ncbi:MAG: hypothetical protein ACYC2H_05500 [Thermoplasmatota archaeon]
MARSALEVTDGLRLDEALQALEGQGFFTVFKPVAGGRVRCASCDLVAPADELRVEARHRVEGVRESAENALVVGLHCSGCNDRGTLVLPYGPHARRDEVEVLRSLHPMRRRPA